MKYIIFKEGEHGKEFPIIFPLIFKHDQIAKRFVSSHNKIHIVSAGFVSHLLKCSEESNTLDTSSRKEEDTDLIRDFFGMASDMDLKITWKTQTQGKG